MSATNLSLISAPHTFVSAEQPWVDTKFCVLDSDIEVQSSDGFIFQLHRLILEANTGAFPGSEIDTQGEVVQLTEPGEVLAILFAFIYPKKFTDTEGQDFRLIAAVAEAAEKYEVFSAMYACNVRLRKFLPRHAAEIFMYAIKHDYPKLINDAVPYFVRSPFVSILAKFPPAYVIPWTLYYGAWTSVFKDAIHDIKKLSNDSSSCHGSYASHGDKTCGTCQSSLFNLITSLEEIDSVSAIREALKSPRSKYPDLKCCKDGSSSYSTRTCTHMDTLTKSCADRIEKIPNFLSFVKAQM